MEYAAPLNHPPTTLIIAEAGVNHNGDLQLALKLCDAAKEAGADIVKFQTWHTDALMLPDAPLAGYQQNNDKTITSQYAMAKALELPYEAFFTIKSHCEKIDIQFLSTPDEEESLDFLVDHLGMNLIKVGSGEITNLPFLAQVGRKKREVILSTGMSDPAEIATAMEVLRTSGAPVISLLHCTSNYPAPMEEVNLKAMQTLKSRFQTVVGYSDHTEGIEVAIAAVALGAGILEKHLTLDRFLPGPDHLASIEPSAFQAMVQGIRNIEKALGSAEKAIQPSEFAIRRAVQKSLVAKVAIMAGDVFSMDNVTAKRAGGGIPASEWLHIEGRRANRNYQPNELIIA
jgi:N,N'-diacetyllegionaminate synthase